MNPPFWPTTSLTTFTWRRWLLVFGLALGVLAGSAYPTYRHYDFSHSHDTLTYLRVARGEFRGSSLTRRYRVVVPFVAAAVAWPLARLGAARPLRLAFYLVNTLLLAAAGLLMFRTCLLYGAAPPAAGLAYAVRHWIDGLAGDPPQASVRNAFAHFENVAYSLRQLFSAHGVGDVFGTFGFFTLFLLAGLFGNRAAVRGWLRPVGWGGVALLAVVAVHMLLSGDLGRIGYLSSPVFAVAFSLLLTRHPAFQWLTGAGSTGPK